MINNNQNNILFTSLQMQQKILDRQVFEQFLAKENHVTCDKPKGHLVKENAVQQFGSMIKDNTQDVFNLTKALGSGKSNDHELGRINDVGKKLGGGLIAAALMGSKSTSNKKLMEVLGFTTFFSVMSLWPKVAISAPTKILHGFDPQQKYVDSQGRKKLFFQDNQYLPWDVWSKEDINKVADYMHISKDMKDREEYTKEKMRTIALQDNTLWMLTAGLASPLLTSLICNRIDEGLHVPVANFELKQLAKEVSADGVADKKGIVETVKEKIPFISKLGKTKASTGIFDAQDAMYAEIKQSLEKGVIPEDFAEKLGKVFDVASVIDNRDVADKFARQNTELTKDLISQLFETKQDYTNSKFLTELVGSEGEDALEEAKDLFKRAVDGINLENAARVQNDKKPVSLTLANVINGVNGLIDGDYDRYASRQWIEKIENGAEGLPENLKALANSGSYTEESIKNGAKILDELYGAIKPIQAQGRIFGQQVKKLDGIAGEKYNAVAKTILKEMNLSDKEITLLRNSDESFGNVMQTIFSEKLATIANDDEKYAKVVDAIKKQHDKVDSVVVDKASGQKTTIKEVFAKAAGKLTETMQEGIGKVASKHPSIQNSKLVKALQDGVSSDRISATRSNMASVDAMYTKLLNALEIERKIADGSLLKDWENFAKQNNLTGNIETLSEEELKNFYNLCRKVGWQMSYGDVMNKLRIVGNGDYMKAVGDTVFNGEVSKDWCQAVKAMVYEPDYVPNSALRIQWKKMFAGQYDKLKEEYCAANNIAADDFEKSYATVAEQLKAKAKELIKVDDTYINEIKKSHGEKFADFGESLLTTFEKQVNNMYCDRKWLKAFGGITIGLVGITLISQLFFGKVRNAELYRQDKKQQ